MVQNYFFCLAVLLSLGFVHGGKDEDILDWRPPRELQQKYPYFLTGTDKEGCPVWVIEFGRWDMKSTIVQGGQIVKDFEKYTEQMVRRWAASTKDFGCKQYTLIADMEYFSNAQIIHIPTVLKYLSIVRQFVGSFKEYPVLKKEYIVNSNTFKPLYVASKPFFGSYASIIELYGNKREEWEAALKTQIPKSQLPEWLGGYRGKKPLKVYG